MNRQWLVGCTEKRESPGRFHLFSSDALQQLQDTKNAGIKKDKIAGEKDERKKEEEILVKEQIEWR